MYHMISFMYRDNNGWMQTRYHRVSASNDVCNMDHSVAALKVIPNIYHKIYYFKDFMSQGTIIKMT